MRLTTCACLALLCLVASIAPAQEVLTNEDIIQLHEAGLPAEVILAKIGSSQTNFDTSVDALVALSEAGLPKEVISEMAGATSAPSSSAQNVVVRQGASAAPNVAAKFGGTPCTSPGIFVERDGVLAELEATTYTAGKSRGRLLSAVTYGAKSVKSKAVVQGTTSSNRAPSGTPNFYFCFEETETGLSYSSSGATNPSEFLLVEMTVNHKARNREFVTGKLNAWVGATSGAPPKTLRETSYEKLAPGVYRVTPKVILSPGEYGFYYAGSAPIATYGFGPTGQGSKIFTFGAD